MAREFEQLSDLLALATQTKEWERIRDLIQSVVLRRYAADAMTILLVVDGGWNVTRARWRTLLTDLEAADPEGIAEIRRILIEHGPDPATDGPSAHGPTHRPTNSPVTIDRITNTVSDATVNDAVTQLGYVGSLDNQRHVAGDNVDLTGNTIHGQVVGIQNNTTHNTTTNNHTTAHYGGSSAPHDWRPVQEVGPAEFGVRPTRRVPGLPDIPPYVARDCDTELADRLEHTGFVLLLTKPLSGTSHTAWHAVTRLTGHRMYAPEPGADLRALPPLLDHRPGISRPPGIYRPHLVGAAEDRPGRYVLWLDALEGHLGGRGLDPGLLGRLNALGVVVLATMDADDYRERRTDRLLATAHTVEVPHRWNGGECKRLRQTDDPRVAEASAHAERGSVAAYLALGHHLREEWRHTRAAHPRGDLLVWAAVDLVRCGVREAVSQDLLNRLYDQPGTETGTETEPETASAPGSVPEEAFAEALGWATRDRFGVAGLSLLVPGESPGTWRAHGALTVDLQPATPSLWLRTIDEATWDDGVDPEALVDRYCELLRPRAQAGNLHTTLMLAELRVRRGDRAEALYWYRKAADEGIVEAAATLGALLTEWGHDQVEAIARLEFAASTGHRDAALLLGDVLRDRTEHWLRTAAEAGDRNAALQLACHQLVPGWMAEGVRQLREAAARGEQPAAQALEELRSALAEGPRRRLTGA